MEWILTSSKSGLINSSKPVESVDFRMIFTKAAYCARLHRVRRDAYRDNPFSSPDPARPSLIVPISAQGPQPQIPPAGTVRVEMIIKEIVDGRPIARVMEMEDEQMRSVEMFSIEKLRSCHALSIKSQLNSKSTTLEVVIKRSEARISMK